MEVYIGDTRLRKARYLSGRLEGELRVNYPFQDNKLYAVVFVDRKPKHGESYLHNFVINLSTATPNGTVIMPLEIPSPEKPHAYTVVLYEQKNILDIQRLKKREDFPFKEVPYFWNLKELQSFSFQIY